MEIFTQFSSDLDETTRRQLMYGQGLMQLLKQPQGHPFALHEQVVILVAATAHVMQDVDPQKILDFRKDLLAYFEQKKASLMQQIDAEGTLSDEQKAEIIETAKEYLELWQTAGK